MIDALRSDERGIALQTAIVMTALIAIGVAVATILIMRGGEVANDLERTEFRVPASAYSNQRLCEVAEYTWTNSRCTG